MTQDARRRGADGRGDGQPEDPLRHAPELRADERATGPVPAHDDTLAGAELKIICEESRERFIPDGLFLKLMPALDYLVEEACKTALYPSGLKTFKETRTRTMCGMDAVIISASTKSNDPISIAANVSRNTIETV